MTDIAPDSPTTDSAANNTGRKKSRWPKKTLIAIAIIGGILVGLPYAISYTINRALLNAGAESANIEDVDFDPFQGDIKVKRLHVKVPELPEVVLDTAYADLGWSALLNKHVVVDHLSVVDTDIRIERKADGSIKVIGLEVLPPGDPNAAPVEKDQGGAIPFIDGAGVKLFELLDINLVYVDPSIDLTLQIDNLRVEKVYSWQADSAAEMVFEGSLNGSPISLHAEVKAFAETQSADVNIKVDALDLNAFEKIAGEAIPALAGKLGIDTQLKVSYQQDLLSVHNEGQVNVSGLDLAFDGGQVQDDQINWNGLLELSLPIVAEGAEPIAPTFTLNAKLDSGALALSLSEPALSVKGEQLSWDGSINQGETGPSSLQVQGAASLANTTVEMAGEQPLSAALAELNVSDLRLSGTDKVNVGGLKLAKASVEMTGDNPLKASIDTVQAKQLQMSGPEQIAIGSVAVAGIDTTIPGDKPMSATVESLSTSDLKVNNSDQVSAAGLDVKGARITDNGAKLDLAAIGAVAVDQIDVKGADAIQLGSIKASDIKALVAAGEGKKAAQMFSAKGFNVTSLAVKNGDEIAINTVELADSKTTLKRLKSGKWYLLDDLSGGDEAKPAKAAPAKAKTEAAAPAPADSSPLKLRITELKATGKNSVHYSDATVSPAADINIIIDAFSITDIDTASPPATPNKFKLAARVGKYGKIDSKGSLRPLSTPPVADLKLDLEAIDLKIASPMLAGAVGYIIESGSLDLDTTFKIDPKGDMSGENAIKLTQLVLKPGDPKVMAKVNNSSPMPLDAALDLLRDKQNVIKMDIPISGNINDPNIDVSDAIGQAIGTIAGKAGMAALTTMGPAAALGPIGLVAIVGKMGADQLSKVRLAAIEYVPGSSDRPASSDKALQDTATVLEKKQELNLRLCPFYTLEDAQAVASAAGDGNAQRSPLRTHQEAIAQLSKKRAEDLKDLLVSQYKLDHKRILTCTPELDDSDGGKPRVEFGL